MTDPYVVPAEGGTWHWQAEAARWDWVSDAPPTDPERVQAVDPGFNGWSASSLTSADARSKNRHVAGAAVAAKAAANPAALTDADLSDMAPELFSQLAGAGQLRHLNIGPRKHAPRRGY
jgi:hypothetical protein